ncbi:fused MFS/spermidine synthase [Pseudoxanthomonas putridarboris]|uniref:Fused MFS/spermidine synthase n=1 Tax=Pseudoxanthomonas putridarboris TaxID=752605 RepID=A0ABU9J125_9GAMM
MKARAGGLMLWLFLASGFAGLVYQSLWSHYLGLVLGHAAYAQSLVLAIFMGGMALGAWAASRGMARWRRLLWMYAVAEGLIGLFGLGFHRVFEGYARASQLHVLPWLGESPWAHAYPWLSCILLLLPACVLLGATFPLLSAGYLRAAPDDAGRALGGLYFSNSLGAALGALAATFALLPALGMPGTLKVAGALNLAVAAGAWWLSRRLGESPSSSADERVAPTETSTATAANAGGGMAPFALTMVALLSSACSFVYEIGWIRLLNQALGTTLHAFELMLAAFLLGLALGGWWVRRRAARLADPLRTAGLAQVAMGVAALLSVVAFAQSFRWVGALMGALARNDGGYALFALGSAGIALLVMLPATFFAGMTLPLFTLAWLRAGRGEAGIGRLYAANTVGAIVGVMLMLHLLIPAIGVRWGLMLAALGDVLLGFWLLARSEREASPRHVAVAATAAAAALLLGVLVGRPDPREQAGGVFRTGTARLDESNEVVFLRDGKTATVSVVRSAHHRSAALATNGKSDAAMTLDMLTPPTGDELTMVALGALPLAVHPSPRTVGVIGWGSGLTTHTLLGSPVVERVETVEIEPAIHAAARRFGARVARAYDDPRSSVHFDDARRFFAGSQRRYDVIVSEPSNPWVSGVANLFTREFYAFLRGRLAEDGVLVQWMQTYEIDDALLASMLAALQSEFPEVDLYLSHDVDLIVVAHAGRRHDPDARRWDHPALREELARVGLHGADALALRHIGDGRVAALFTRAMAAPAHSDYTQHVALRAPATRFRRDFSQTLQQLADNGLPVLDLLTGRSPVPADAVVKALPEHRFTLGHRHAGLAAALLRGEYVHPIERATLPVALGMAVETLRGLSADAPQDEALWMEAAAQVAEATLGWLPAADLQGVWIAPAWWQGDEAPPALEQVMALYRAAARRDPAAMRQAGEAVLRSPAGITPRVREHALVIAQLGAIGMRDFAAVERLHRDHGDQVAQQERFRMARHLIRVWAMGEGRFGPAAVAPGDDRRQGAAPVP